MSDGVLISKIVERFHWWSLYLRMLRKGLQLKTTSPVSFLSVVSKVFKNLVNNRIIHHLEKCGLFSDFHYGFRSSQSTADFLIVVSDRIPRAFNRSGSTRAIALDISKAFVMVWHIGLLHKLKLMSAVFYQIFIFSRNDSPSKAMENVFYFI